MTYLIISDNDEILVYKTKKILSHHKNGYKSIIGERIPLENISKDTLVKLTQKGVAKTQCEVLP